MLTEIGAIKWPWAALVDELLLCAVVDELFGIEVL